MSDIDKMKSVNNLFSIDVPAASYVPVQNNDLFDCLEIGPNGELMLKNENSSKVINSPPAKQSSNMNSSQSSPSNPRSPKIPVFMEPPTHTQHDSSPRCLKVTVSRYHISHIASVRNRSRYSAHLEYSLCKLSLASIV